MRRFPIAPFLIATILMTLALPCRGEARHAQSQTWEKLDAEVNALGREGRYDKAISAAVQAVALARKTFGETDSRTSTSLSNLAWLYRETGRFKQAITAESEALKIDRKNFGNNNLTVGTDLNNLGLLYSNDKEYGQAIRSFRQALKIYGPLGGRESAGVRTILSNLASAYENQGEFGNAEKIWNDAAESHEKIPGENDPQIGVDLNNLGLAYYKDGKYSEAEAAYGRALKMDKALPQADRPQLATTLSNLGLLYFAEGRYAEAEPLDKQALQIDLAAYGANNPSVFVTANNLLVLYETEGAYAAAEPVAKQLVDGLRQQYGINTPIGVNFLNNLARIYQEEGKFGEAEETYKEALGVAKKVLGTGDILIGILLNNLATTYWEDGKPHEAELFYGRALRFDTTFLGGSHPEVASTLENMAMLKARMGNANSAFQLMRQSLSIDQRILGDVFSLSSEEEKFSILDKVMPGYEAFLNLVFRKLPRRQSFLVAALNEVLRLKGIVLDALSMEHEALFQSGSAAIRLQMQKLNFFSSNLASLILAGPSGSSPASYRKKLAALQASVEALQKKLAAESGADLYQGWSRKIDPARVAALLPEGSALVEFVSIPSLNFNPEFKEKEWGENHYYAIVLPASKHALPRPRLVDLGKASVVDDAVRAFRRDVVSSETDLSLDQTVSSAVIKGSGHALYRLVFSPLKPALGGIRTLFISPDGELNLIPFEALSDDKGDYLIEHYRFDYLSSGRDLIRNAREGEKRGETVIVADPDYDMSLDSRSALNGALAREGKLVATRGSAELRGLAGLRWPGLPGTEEEAIGIKAALRGEPVMLYDGSQALKDRILELKSPFRLHIATHGFFLKDENITAGIENPLFQSGLVLAGANHSENGILTAFEVSGMDLQGTDLVVLSACDTGLGKVRNGEGVFGLRRSFELAGARTIVMSLWEVPDKQTKELMTDFYRRLRGGEKKAGALQDSQLDLIRRWRKLHHFIPPPFYWGAFVSVGEP